VIQTYIDGQLVADGGQTTIQSKKVEAINRFNCTPKSAADFVVPYTGQQTIQAIECFDGQLITNKFVTIPRLYQNQLISDPQRDLLKIVVVNRYKDAPIAKAFIKNAGLKQGAIASSVAHDSHNIVAIGVDDESICKAVNAVIEQQGGISCVSRE